MSRFISAVIITALHLCDNGILAAEDLSVDRTQKHFSLFSVVTFKNEECTSETTLTGGARKGTCYTTTECSDKSGLKSGNCASGFGVCCVFIDNGSATKTLTENRTHIRNAEYPSYATATATTTIVYTLSKMQSDICQIRLDFTSFVIAGPLNSLENIVAGTQNHHCTNDALTIAATGYTNGWPTMCGILTGQHLYIELSPTSTDAATVTIKTSTTAGQPTAAIAKRLWDFQTSQIPCYATYRAPNGCHRYRMETAGKITSLNFYMVSGSTRGITTAQNSGVEIASQNLNTCIRRSKGMCCVEYQVCVSDTQGIELTDTIGTEGDIGTAGMFNEGWSLDTATDPILADEYSSWGLTDSQCSKDYVEIPSSWSGACGANGSARSIVNSRYCGSKFGANYQFNTLGNLDSYSSGIVCDCSEPFQVRHGSDAFNDEGLTTSSENLTVGSRGFCLDYVQKPCNN